MTQEQDREAEARRRILRRAQLYSLGFVGAALLLAVIGAALVAWMFSTQGLPFRETWLVIMAVLILPGAIAMFVRLRK